MNHAASSIKSILARASRPPHATPDTQTLPPVSFARPFAVLLLDNSGSMAASDWHPSRLAGAQNAAASFIRERIAADRNAHIGIVNFETYASVPFPLAVVSPVDPCLRALSSLQTGGNTDMCAGLELAASELTRSCGRRLSSAEMVVLTDGHSTREAEAQRVARDLHERACVVHVVGIGGNPSAVNEAFLRSVASRGSDGRPLYRFISDSGGLVSHFSDLGGGITR